MLKSQFGCLGLLLTVLHIGALASPSSSSVMDERAQWCEAAIWKDTKVPPPGSAAESLGGHAKGRFFPKNLIYSLALSGGGFRAMVFHIGTLRRMNDAGLLSRLTMISSVSGGSIAASTLAYKWPRLDFNEEGIATNFSEEVEEPLRAMARTTLDAPSIISGLILPFTSAASQMSRGLEQNLFQNQSGKRAMLQEIEPGVKSRAGDVPRPVFVLVATSLQTGEMWQFRGRAMGGPMLGWTNTDDIALADAVAASAGFPPMFAHLTLDLSGRHPWSDWYECVEMRDHPFGVDYRNEPGKVIPTRALPDYRKEVIFVDGGVRDNLGIAVIEETNRVRRIRSQDFQPQTATFISDAGLSTGIELDPASNWWSTLRRVTDMMSDEPNDLRVSNLVRAGSQTHLVTADYKPFLGNDCLKGSLGDYKVRESKLMAGEIIDRYAYWSIRRMPKNHIGFGCLNPNSPLKDEVRTLSQIETRLATISDSNQARLINWGYLAAHQGIPYIPNLIYENMAENLLKTCSIPFPGNIVDPSGENPTARHVTCPTRDDSSNPPQALGAH